jgi:hypothetical protein
MVILCLPGFAIANELLRIKEYLRPRCKVGSIVASTGFFFMAKELLEKDTPLFGFQRVPYIARLTQYGHSANLSLIIYIEAQGREQPIHTKKRRICDEIIGDW